MNAIRQFLGRVKKSGTRRPGFVTTVAMGREREFCAWDVGDDTFVFEKGVSGHLDERPSVLMVEKRDLWSRRPGRVFTMTTGNHSVAAFPLLDGRFWKLSRVPAQKRGETLMHAILCANVVNGTIEISQRDVPAKKLYAADAWLLGAAVLVHHHAVALGERALPGGEQVALRPLVEGAVLEVPFAAAFDRLKFAALGAVLEFVRRHVDVLGGLGEV